MTNYDKIRLMSIEEMARFLCDLQQCWRCQAAGLCDLTGEAANGMLRYLKLKCEETEP